MYYKICPNCGTHLDPGEKCDCSRGDIGDTVKKECVDARNTDTLNRANRIPTTIRPDHIMKRGITQ